MDIKRIKQICTINIQSKQKYTLYEIKTNLKKVHSDLHDFLFINIEDESNDNPHFAPPEMQ